MTNVFLGYPPEYIMVWIDKHISIEPADHEKTYIWFEGDTEDAYTEYDWSGEINRQTMVDEGWFNKDKQSWTRNLVKVEIGTKATSIGNDAFTGCSSLTTIIIPDSVTSIYDGAFAWCSNLTSIAIPNSVTSIQDGTFSGCYHLATITIGNSITSIGNYAFNSCSNLTSISIPDSVESIGSRTFDSCYNLTSISIPDSVENIGNYAFNGCYNLTTASILGFTQEQIEANAENWQLGYKYDDSYNLITYPVTVTAKNGITFVLHQS